MAEDTIKHYIRTDLDYVSSLVRGYKPKDLTNKKAIKKSVTIKGTKCKQTYWVEK